MNKTAASAAQLAKCILRHVYSCTISASSCAINKTSQLI